MNDPCPPVLLLPHRDRFERDPIRLNGELLDLQLLAHRCDLHIERALSHPPGNPGALPVDGLVESAVADHVHVALGNENGRVLTRKTDEIKPVARCRNEKRTDALLLHLLPAVRDTPAEDRQRHLFLLFRHGIRTYTQAPNALSRRL